MPGPPAAIPGLTNKSKAKGSVVSGLSIRSHCPSLFQINTRATLQELSRKLGRPATLEDFPDSELDHLAKLGFEWIWFLGVWQTGPAGQRVSRQHHEWIAEFQTTLPDFKVQDVSGSCFAITDYSVHTDFGGNKSMRRLEARIHDRGMRLLLDFVPNHTALDHPWVQRHPEFYIAGTEEKLQREPHNYIRIKTAKGTRVFAYGRDPYFAGWPDTLQLNYAEPAFQEAMRKELLKVSELCDGVRCDMAMLILPEVFERTWGLRPVSFWPNAINFIRAHKRDFLFMAEVYWDLEWTLQQEGFDYTYDKRLYDRLREVHTRAVRDHFRADIEFQYKLARFLENHDEPRSAAVFEPETHRAAAVLTYLCPGLRFFHDGQFEGRAKKLSVHLGRRPAEPVDISILTFYDRLLACVRLPVAQDGEWKLLECTPAWEGNWTWDNFICFGWQAPGQQPLLVVVNYSPVTSQCYVHSSFDGMDEHAVRLQDLMSSTAYLRDGDDLLSRGLYLDVPPWDYHVFELSMLEKALSAMSQQYPLQT
jgi:hypothetical protein